MKSSNLILFLLAILFTSCGGQQNSDEEIHEKALKIHESVLAIDSHNDTPMRFTRGNFNIGEAHDAKQGGGRVDFPRMKEGGLDGAFFAVFVGQGARDEEGNARAYKSAMRVFDGIDRVLQEHAALAGLATTPDDAYALEKEGKRAFFIGMENGYPIGHDVTKIEEFYNLGTRYITLCHTRNNDICDSSGNRNGPEHDGLSEFGEKVVDEMNRLGIMIDISHASDKSFYDVIDRSKAPIIASHSSARAICDSKRNLDDDMLKALAENGGVMQLCILSSYIKEPEPNPERDSAQAALRQKFEELAEDDSVGRQQLSKEWSMIREKYPRSTANVQDAVDHIDHVVDLIGIDHIGIGTDFDGGGGIQGCNDVSEMPNITIELVKRGYTKKEIKKIWGGNIMRVLSEVETVAAKLQAE